VAGDCGIGTGGVEVIGLDNQKVGVARDAVQLRRYPGSTAVAQVDHVPTLRSPSRVRGEPGSSGQVERHGVSI